LKILRQLYEWRIYAGAKTLFFQALFYSGLLSAFRFFHRNALLVITYHDVLPGGFPENNPLFGMTVATDEFEWQLDYIVSRYNPVSLAEVLDWLNGNGQLPSRPVLITFDDGHANNVRYALPHLKERGVPFTCFVVASALGEQKLLWFEEGYSRILYCNTKVWQLQSGESVPLETPEQRSLACSKFFMMFRKLSEAEQESEISHLRAQLPLEKGAGSYPSRFDFLSKEELIMLRANGGAIGAHTMTHPILASQSSKNASDEIGLSKAVLEKALGTTVQAFAYPFGMPQLDFSMRDSETVKQAGFSLAFAANSGFVTKNCDRFSLPRIGIGRMSKAQFAATLSGALHSIKGLAGLGN
jgi:peptidoglycan/xylan/chitin deacetylase (PgdA/CDA1 family)